MNTRLEVKYEFGEPMSVSDLTESLSAMDAQYKAHATSANYPEAQDGVALHVKAVREGSIIFDLVSLLEQLNHLTDTAGSLAGFVTNWHELTEFLIGRRDAPPKEISKAEAQRITNIVGPVAGDNKGGITIQAMEGSTVIISSHINPIEANAIQNKTRQIIAQTPLPEDNEFKQEIMVMYQTRDSANTQVGDLAIIGKLTERPLKVLFDGDTKQDILAADTFHTLFIVSGSIKVYGDKPRAYLIKEVHGSMPKDDQED